MKQEDKELLIKDLCARLPYNCKVAVAVNGINGLQWNITTLNLHLLYQIEEEDSLEYVKPYLRSIDSMTSEEIDKYHSYCEEVDDGWYDGCIWLDTCESYDYLNSIHVDYRDLIPNGLAIEVTN